ncbi:alpha/beta hydrolase family esterase [Megalodesulfovibrio gigas]|uniref:Putative poly (3-hydroxybutyrate) depolymerase protein n=1 Tax=Megalodesulfovibrio gigas (strain ATCC 19364 / DSM 1382 / NCIMB 9332 / VKM B-1759) TaxID=1121448 RepID=T2G6S4_MEGG1|nr:PHB depolymerase family esterase [Megalodesulfovibrio gigas]AGW12290.1 putative poly (3-hydroxybutyrate) depolymerase protein [Megalodesulfovibrio gigas DSM 1382 = ATCC 19364]
MRYSLFMILALCLLAACPGCKSGKARTGRGAAAPAQSQAQVTQLSDDVSLPARPVLFEPPPKLARERAALIFLHDAGSSPQQAARSLGLEAAARDAGVLLAIPQGSGPAGALAWNAGSCCGEAQATQTPDAAWLVSLIRVLPGKFGVDPARIYLAGKGAGGMMAYRMACEHADLLAGVAVVGASLDAPGCVPAKALPVLHVHGMEDRRHPYFGGQAPEPLGEGLRTMNSAIRSAMFWARSNRCATQYTRFTQGDAIWERFEHCAAGADVTLLSLSATAGRGGDPYAGYPVGFKILEYFGLTKKWDTGKKNSIDAMPGMR